MSRHRLSDATAIREIFGFGHQATERTNPFVSIVLLQRPVETSQILIVLSSDPETKY